ncbi:MAG: IPT/TIG domain-containing protein [Chloroflexota bacterium]
MRRCLNVSITIVVLFAAVTAGALLPATACAADSAHWVSLNSGITTDLNGIWGTSASNVFAVGSAGMILRYDGRSWKPMASGSASGLYGIWGSSASDVFAVGTDGTILHYDGKTWETMTSNITTDLYGVWGTSATNVFTVGLGGTILQYDGKTWEKMSSGTEADLLGIWGASFSDIFVVGSTGVVVHYDGRSWSEMVTDEERNLLWVWGNSGSDVYAVGGSGAILHYDGKSWVGMLSGTTSNLLAVWGSSGSNIYAVGVAGTAIYYNGKAWSPMTRDTINDLNGLWGISPNEVLAVGQSGTVLRYAPPSVTSAVPVEGIQGATLSVTITGKNLAGASDVRFGTGIAVNSFTAAVPGQITAYITIVPGAATGPRDISVTTVGGTATLVGGFIVKQALPVVVSVEPNQANRETSINVVVAGANFTSATAVSFGDGITVNSFAALGSVQITANITVTAGAAMGKRGVTVTTPGGTATLPDGFTVKQALPAISSVSPNQGMQGATLDITITGKNFTGASEVRFGPGVAVNRFTVPNPSEITANITIVGGATTGTREVSVTTPGGASALPDSFTVKQGLPVIASVSPAQGSPGDTLDVIINGSNLDGASSVSFGSEVAVNSFSNRSPTQIAARIVIARNAAAGARDVSVTTGGGTGILASSFIVKEGPLGTLFIALVWVGIAIAVVGLLFVLRTLRRRRASGL